MSRPRRKRQPLISEADLVEKLARMLREEGYRVRTEISNMGQSVDLVATRGRWVTVVEVKLYNWRRALEQCLAHEQVADFICVAVGSVTVPEALLAAARVSGYGVIHYDRRKETFHWARRPRLNRRVWVPQRRQWVRGMKGIGLCQLTTG